MSGQHKQLEFSAGEFAVIESALQTQSKILDVQATAGAEAALTRLNEVKRVLARFEQLKPAEERTCRVRNSFSGWLSVSRLFG